VNRYAMTMYEKRPTRRRDVPKSRDDVVLPVFTGWEGTELTAAIEAGYRALPPSFDEGTEDKISRILLDIFRHKKGAGAELPPIKPTVGEILSNPKNLTYHLLAYNPDYPGYGWDDIIEYTHRVPEVEALMRQAMVLHNQYRWDRAKTRVIEVGKLHDDDFVVVFQPRSTEVLQFIRRVKGGRAPPDIEWVQTYASGPMSEVDSIIWPNPEFDNNITVYGPQVMALVRRYLTQMIDELRGLPHPDGTAGSLLDSVDLIVPHQANKTTVVELAEAAGVGPERLYFDIEKVGNTSSASIPIAIHDAVREGVIDRPMRIFAPGFGAGAVAGYVVARIDPAIIVV